eukprot:TRINITY_DN37383_c0_g1_i1.p1 TRINITY_DN37383_c0_g1~~TRINITY_DN37383_c0_g1_i1.p1  ORF type:complete len:744 (-),score=108.95 TRINITY_DN37383_c0_g1_i1:111-2027(-)
MVLVPVGAGTGLLTAFLAFGESNTFGSGVADMLCHAFNMADETLNGSPSLPSFLGVDTGIQRVGVLRQLLDVDGRSMTDVRGILDETSSFGTAMERLSAKIDHMQRVLTVVGQYKIKDHTCWFCRRAVGNNQTSEIGLLAELTKEIQGSSADAMRSIRATAASTLTGRPLIDLSAAVQRGGVALDSFKRSYAGTFVDGLLAHRVNIQSFEDIRATVFVCLCAFSAILLIVVSNMALVHARQSKSKYPNPVPSCAAWFCAICAVTFSLLFGGILVLVAVPMSEFCEFMRQDLLTYEGIGDYYRQIGLYNPVDPTKAMDHLAVDIFRTCLTANGTGDILTAMQLSQQLEFQKVLDAKFVELDDKMAGMVVDTAKFELLVSLASSFGGLFILDPDRPLPLDTNAAPKLMGSSLYPDDRRGPDGESLLTGLNTYAGLIAGPGHYSFLHGTSGGGKLITATSPSEADVQDKPLPMQNALIYARQKEQILSDPSLFRCDLLDSNLKVVERRCSYQEFTATVTDYAKQVRDAGLKLGAEAEKAKQLIASDLRDSLRSMLTEVRELRMLFRCRFLWKRWEDFEFITCNTILPAAIQGAMIWFVFAGGVLVIFFVHYKVWRHLLDNKVVGQELEKFSKKYGYVEPKK